jgi:hypothetical protein
MWDLNPRPQHRPQRMSQSMPDFDINGIISNIPVKQLGQVSNIEHPPFKSDAHQKQFIQIMNLACSLPAGGSAFLVLSILGVIKVITATLFPSLCEISVSIIPFIIYI